MVRVHVVRAKCLKRTQVYPKYDHEAPKCDHTDKETLETGIRLTQKAIDCDCIVKNDQKTLAEGLHDHGDHEWATTYA